MCRQEMKWGRCGQAGENGRNRPHSQTTIACTTVANHARNREDSKLLLHDHLREVVGKSTTGPPEIEYSVTIVSLLAMS